MKRAVLILTFMIVILIPSFAAWEPQTMSKPLHLQAAAGEVGDISVTRIPSQSQKYMIGMPFNIEDEYVQYRADGNGREIAEWTMLSNAPFKLRITAEDMKHMENPDAVPLTYILQFSYNLGYTLGDDTRRETGSQTFWLDNGTDTTSDNGTVTPDGKFEFEIFPDVVNEGLYVGSIVGDIFFMFSSDSSKDIKNYKGVNTALPPGNYSATVRIEMITEGA